MYKMKYNTYKTLFYAGLLSFSVGFCMTSCEDYLDKSPESTVSEEDAFKNFRNFQGFIEEIYNCIPDKEKCNYCTSWNWGDDELFNSMGDEKLYMILSKDCMPELYSRGKSDL